MFSQMIKIQIHYSMQKVCWHYNILGHAKEMLNTVNS